MPVTDAEGLLLPIQFVVDPGPEVVWGRDEADPMVQARLTLQPQHKLSLLREYLDVLELPLEAPSSPSAALAPAPPPPPRPSSAAELRDSERGRSRPEPNLQLQTVVRHMGSIGKSMGKKIRENLGSLSARMAPVPAKRAASAGEERANGDGRPVRCQCLLAARLDTSRQYRHHEDMIKNYLSSARQRYSDLERSRAAASAARDCGCTPRVETGRGGHGVGRSTFYAGPDPAAYARTRHMPTVSRTGPPDPTLYLSRSTFYNDRSCASRQPLG